MEALCKIGKRALSEKIHDPIISSFWLPHFEKTAKAFIKLERAHLRRALKRAHLEVEGTFRISEAQTPITIRGRADRIDVLKNGKVAIYDYKTGALPTKKDVKAGFKPQLPLISFIAEIGNFEGIPPADISGIAYIAFNPSHTEKNDDANRRATRFHP